MKRFEEGSVVVHNGNGYTYRLHNVQNATERGGATAGYTLVGGEHDGWCSEKTSGFFPYRDYDIQGEKKPARPSFREVVCAEGSSFTRLVVRCFVGGGEPEVHHIEVYEDGLCQGTAQLDRAGAVDLVKSLLHNLGADDIGSDLDFLKEEE